MEKAKCQCFVDALAVLLALAYAVSVVVVFHKYTEPIPSSFDLEARPVFPITAASGDPDSPLFCSGNVSCIPVQQLPTDTVALNNGDTVLHFTFKHSIELMRRENPFSPLRSSTQDQVPGAVPLRQEKREGTLLTGVEKLGITLHHSVSTAGGIFADLPLTGLKQHTRNGSTFLTVKELIEMAGVDARRVRAEGASVEVKLAYRHSRQWSLESRVEATISAQAVDQQHAGHFDPPPQYWFGSVYQHVGEQLYTVRYNSTGLTVKFSQTSELSAFSWNVLLVQMTSTYVLFLIASDIAKAVLCVCAYCCCWCHTNKNENERISSHNKQVPASTEHKEIQQKLSDNPVQLWHLKAEEQEALYRFSVTQEGDEREEHALLACEREDNVRSRTAGEDNGQGAPISALHLDRQEEY